jgi:hypothetical protein
MQKKGHIALFFALITCGAVTVAKGQNKSFLGTKTPYTFTAVTYTPPPAGFEPVFVNYVGRHGARFLTKAGSDIRLLQLLLQAEQSHSLTPAGKQLLAMTQRFLTIENGNYENISLLGKEEQAGIGERILQYYNTAFKGRGLDIQVTHKVRTRQSADAFLRSFANYTGPKAMFAASDTADNILRFYDLSPAYQSYKKNPVVLQHLDSLDNDSRSQQIAAAICAKVFSPKFATAFLQQGVTINVDHKPMKIDAVVLAENLYDLYSIQFSIPLEMKQQNYAPNSIDFSKVLDQTALQWLSFKNSAADFLEKGAGLDTLGIQTKIAAPLLVDFLNSTTAVVNGTLQKDAVLRFTHAEAISPLATLLGIPAASKPTSAIYTYDQYWQSADIIPLSANIQWILYSNGKDYLVKALLNEREVALPVKTNQYPYYRWEDIQQYYIAKLQTIHTSPDDDMQEYLQQLK